MDNRKVFIDAEVMVASVTAAFGRAPIYAGSPPDAEKRVFRLDLQSHLTKLLSGYTTAATDERHMSNLAQLCSSMTERHEALLVGGRFRLGIAQKALNLLLKYHWCLGRIPEPPHCPFDSIVIAPLKLPHILWTRMDSIEEYRQLVAAARKCAGNTSIARWELELWQRKVHPNNPSE